MKNIINSNLLPVGRIFYTIHAGKVHECVKIGIRNDFKEGIHYGYWLPSLPEPNVIWLKEDEGMEAFFKKEDAERIMAHDHYRKKVGNSVYQIVKDGTEYCILEIFFNEISFFKRKDYFSESFFEVENIFHKISTEFACIEIEERKVHEKIAFEDAEILAEITGKTSAMDIYRLCMRYMNSADNEQVVCVDRNSVTVSKKDIGGKKRFIKYHCSQFIEMMKKREQEYDFL